MKYVICAFDANKGKIGNFSHGQTILIGKIREIIPDPNQLGKYLIIFREYAPPITNKIIWKDWKNPVHYINLKANKLDVIDLKFQPNLKRLYVESAETVRAKKMDIINSSKKIIADEFGVTMENVSISIKFD